MTKERINPMNQVKTFSDETVKKTYTAFSKLNGEHPFKTQVPEGRVEYQAAIEREEKLLSLTLLLRKKWV